MIQKNIIQTYELEYKNLPQEALVNIKRWKELNPEWNYMYFSNIDRENFIKFNFDYKWFKIYKDLPLGIMKANLFKYLSLYIYRAWVIIWVNREGLGFRVRERKNN